jgi:DOPA 4,5-dioxygenase
MTETESALPIAGYHAHIYYDAATRARAERLRERLAAGFPEARLGRWHDVPVGPHTQAMYQVAFPAASLARLFPWLLLNRDGLAVLLHPETGDDLADHTAHAAWMGAMLPLNLAALASPAGPPEVAPLSADELERFAADSIRERDA